MAAKINFPQMSILVVDDEQFSLSIVTRLAKIIGFGRVFKAADGKEAAALLRDRSLPRIDMAIVDFNMPRLNGLQLLHRIRSGEEKIRRELPILMLTGNADKDLVGTAIALDVDAFIVKPVSKETLENRMTRVVNNPAQIKDESFYKKIKVPESLAMVGQQPKKEKAVEQAEEIVPNARKITLNELMAGHTLAADLEAGGSKLLAKNTKMTSALVSRINDLEDLKNLIGPIWVKDEKLVD